MAHRIKNQSRPRLYQIVKGPNRWDLMMMLFGENRDDRTVTFVIDANLRTRKKGQPKAELKIEVSNITLGVPEDDGWPNPSDDTFSFRGTANDMRCYRGVTGGYDVRTRSGDLSFVEV
jgi:hypothetical protein